MIVKRMWTVERGGFGLFRTEKVVTHHASFCGWFLFGVLPLFVKQETVWLAGRA